MVKWFLEIFNASKLLCHLLTFKFGLLQHSLRRAKRILKLRRSGNREIIILTLRQIALLSIEIIAFLIFGGCVRVVLDLV